MATTKFINTIQNALDNKVNAIDVAVESNGVRIKNVKFAHEVITGSDIQSIWAELCGVL